MNYVYYVLAISIYILHLFVLFSCTFGAVVDRLPHRD